MKKLMMLSGAYSVLAFILGSFFKIMFWQGASFFLVTAILMFSMVFLPLVLLLKTRETGTNREKIVMGMATLVGTLYCLSALFQVQHWQGSRIIWLTTLSLSCFVLIPLYFINGIRKPETKVNTIVTTIILIGVLGVQFTLTALRRPVTQSQTVVSTNVHGERSAYVTVSK